MFTSKKMKLGRSHVRSHAGSHDYRSYDHGIKITFFFGVNSDKQVIVKSYLQLNKKSLNFIRETRGKPSIFIDAKNLLAL